MTPYLMPSMAFDPLRSLQLDGLKPGPVLLGEAGSDWQGVAKGRIHARINRYAAAEIKFNVLSVIPSKLTSLEAALAAAPDDGTLKIQLEDEKAKRKKWDEENVRRKVSGSELRSDEPRILVFTSKVTTLVAVELCSFRRGARQDAWQRRND